MYKAIVEIGLRKPHSIFFRDLEQKKEALAWELVVNGTLAELANMLIGPERSLEEISVEVLNAAKTLTGSRHGYASAVDPETGEIVYHTANRNKGGCDIAEGDSVINFQRRKIGRYDGLKGHGLDTGETFYTNSPQTHHSFAGTPEGHIVLESFLSTPVMVGGELLGQIALANSDESYTDQHLGAVKRLAALFALSLQRHRVQEELLKHQHQLEKLVEERTATLGRSEEQYKRLVEGSPGILYSYSVKHGGRYYSSRAESILGYSVAELRENRFLWRDAIHPDDREKVTKAMKVSAGKKYDLEYRIKDASGGWHWFHDRSIGDRKEDEDAIVEGLALDITEQKRAVRDKEQLERKLMQSQKMEAIGTLAGGIAHDFNNILGIISGYTEMALFSLPDVKEVERRLTQVQKASERATSLIEQILAFSRQEEQEMIPVQIGGIIEEVLKLLRASLPTTIEIRSSIEAAEDAILADPTQIHQVLMNLAANAGHAMRENGGVLDIVLTDSDREADEEVTVSDLLPDSCLKLTVSDTGDGISPSVAERIFEPYYTTKAKGEGTGLGLSVVHGIIKNIGGVITVSSTPGQGTSFQIFLPKVKGGITGNIETSQEILKGSESILLIDDEAELAEMTREMLEDIGYNVTIRTNSREALALFRGDADLFDLVITDQTMPQITGMGLIEALLHIRPDIPIILCSGFMDRGLEKQIEAAGIKEFVMKPLTIGKISKTIRKIMDS